MPDGGRVTIETSSVTLHDDYCAAHVGVRAGRYARLSVSDTGIGMSQELQARIFEPFFTTKEKGKGTGLGLSTVYGIVKQSGGNITVESAPDRGAIFRIYFPRVAQDGREVAGAAEASDSARGRETILLVEDEPAVRGLVHETLRLHGYTVLEARHVIEALMTGAKHQGRSQ